MSAGQTRDSHLRSRTSFALSLFVSRGKRLDTDPVVHGFPKTLLTSQVLFGGLYRHMAKKELNLIQLAASFTTKACTRTSKIVGSQLVDSGSLGAVFDDVPHDPLRYTCSPGLARPANTPEHAPLAYAGGLAPGVNGRLDPVGNRHRADVSAFADQVDDGPVILPALNMRELKLCNLSTAQPAAQ